MKYLEDDYLEGEDLLKEISEVDFVIEETEEDKEGEAIYWESVLDEMVYSEFDFSKRNFNAIADFRKRLYEIAATPLDERDSPYDTWEPDDFYTLELLLRRKILEIDLFIGLCEKLESVVKNTSDEKNEKVLDLVFRLLERKNRLYKFSRNTIERMENGLRNYYNAIFQEE